MKNRYIGKALPLLLGSALLFWSCQTDKKAKYSKGSTLSLDSFFNGEIEKLTKLNPLVEKTVIKDEDKEVKSLRISNWQNELSGFISADITQDADSNLYDFKEVDCKITYQAKKPQLAIQYLAIEQDNDGQIKQVVIRRKVDNSLYSSNEQLTYDVDSSYQIEKKQDILVLGKSHYKITGRLKHD
ncbi:hypothetical protein KO02_11745 [Sphingobacterium sp. ML3W]|uniref:hypothetical protein n=1 Tax=Sphingobacterium sp. ML3W TaxID=1538644 RepID=UPI0004F6E51B|nr:hypothetical protein [Sphingobacterium sp. ML3W]AIM37285.1 hypothetical protein KO02_11745 [Sphingobacterium sp. ML3W]